MIVRYGFSGAGTLGVGRTAIFDAESEESLLGKWDIWT